MTMVSNLMVSTLDALSDAVHIKFRTNGANVEANSKLWVCIIGSVSVFLPL